MFAMPLVYAQLLVADRQRSYEAVASRRRMRRQARHQTDDAVVGIRRSGRAPVMTPIVHHDTAPHATTVQKVA